MIDELIILPFIPRLTEDYNRCLYGHITLESNCPFIDPNDNLSCYKLTIYSARLLDDEGDEDEENLKWYFVGNDYTDNITDNTYEICIYLYHKTIPTISDFINHIKSEIIAIKSAITSNREILNILKNPDRNNIFPDTVYLYTIQIYKHLGYISYPLSDTLSFINVYDFWLERLYNTSKFINYLTNAEYYKPDPTNYFDDLLNN